MEATSPILLEHVDHFFGSGALRRRVLRDREYAS